MMKDEAMSHEGDEEQIMDHVAMECMHAIENKDKSAFKDAFHVLVSDIVNKMMPEEGEGEANVNGR